MLLSMKAFDDCVMMVVMMTLDNISELSLRISQYSYLKFLRWVNELALTMIGSIQVSLTMIDNDWTVWPVPDLNHTLAALMCPLACWGWHLVDDNDEEIEIMNNKIIKICLIQIIVVIKPWSWPWQFKTVVITCWYTLWTLSCTLSFAGFVENVTMRALRSHGLMLCAFSWWDDFLKIIGDEWWQWCTCSLVLKGAKLKIKGLARYQRETRLEPKRRKDRLLLCRYKYSSTGTLNWLNEGT